MDNPTFQTYLDRFGTAKTFAEITEVAGSLLGKLDTRPTHDLFLRVSVVTDSPEDLAKALAEKIAVLPRVLSASPDGWDELSYPNLTSEDASG